MKKQNKKLAFDLYKNKWGLQGYRFFRINNPSQLMLYISYDCEENKLKFFIGAEITQLSSFMKAARHPNTIFHVYDEHGLVGVEWTYEEFLSHLLLRKIAGI